ncbi:MAG: hypothetical protein JKY95_13600 [Planctomycetaceae bacterium]|nr:hypothetical protein [Planctomycetaceae bacterium]
MNFKAHLGKSLCAVLLGLLSTTSLTGCQTQMGGQTLPSAFYLTDDVQYFPPGPEEMLPNLQRALKEYKTEQKAQRDGLNAP